MARIRNIKPAFFKDAELFDAEMEAGLPLRVAYAGLWTVADRAGRFKWKPREIKTDILPYDSLDMEDVLNALVKYRFIFKYKAGGFDYGFIPNFEKHQFINRNEAQSTIPAPDENSNAQREIVSSDEYTGTLDTDTDGLTQTQESAAPPLAPKSVRKVTSALPGNFPPPNLLADARSYWKQRDREDLDAEDQAEQFRAHHKAHGKRMADWGQAWVTWYSNSIKFNRKPTNGQRRQSPHEAAFDVARDYCAEILADGQGAQGGGADETALALLPAGPNGGPNPRRH